MIRRFGVLALLVAVGLAAALVILAGRVQIERAARTVEVIVDGPAWRDLAVREGRDPGAFFGELRGRGVSSVALYESTLRLLQQQGRLAYRSGGEVLASARLEALLPEVAAMLSAGGVRREAVYVLAPPALRGWVEDAFRGLLAPDRVRRRGEVIEVLGIREDLEELGLGFLPEDVEAIRRAGFALVLRPRNYRGLTAAGLTWKLDALKTLGAPSTVVFEGADVLGFERLIDQSAAGLRALGYRHGRVEAFIARRRQRGEDALTVRMRPAVLRLFSLTPEEMAVLPPASIVDKFVRAALERNIRLLYVRPMASTTAGVDAVAANLQMVESVVRGVQRRGFAVGVAAPLPDAPPSFLLLMLVAAGALALGTVTLAELAATGGLPLPPVIVGGLLVGGLAVTAAAAASGEATFALWRQALALGTAVAGATLAVTVSLARAGGGPVRRGLAALWTASILSAAAGVLVAALLIGWPFMLAVRTFLGVKVAHVLPPILVGFLLAFGGRRGDVRSTVRQIWHWLDRPLRLQYAVVAVLVAVVAVMLLARSGNFGLPVSAFEVRLREVLEDIFVARPRTKEFLIGHPALILAAAAGALGARAAVIPLAIVAAIGQAGLINSFSHIHTPLLLVALRTVYALVIGSFLGSAAVIILQPIVRRFVPHPPAREPSTAAAPRRAAA